MGIPCLIAPRSFSSRRPLKVERGRKKSELIPERRMEKKKGEGAGAVRAGQQKTEIEGSWGCFPRPGEGSFQLGSLLVGPCRCCCDPCTVLGSIYGVCRDSFPAGIPFPLGHTPACPFQSNPWGCFQPWRHERKPNPFWGESFWAPGRCVLPP